MAASDITVRSNGEKILNSWFNTIRTYLINIEAFLGAGYVIETSFTIANNQSSAANVTGLVFSGASVRAAQVDYVIYRNTTGGGAMERVQAGTLTTAYKTVAATWETPTDVAIGDAGVTFTITSAGQIQYTSDSQSGVAATSVMKFRARTFAA